MTVTIEQIRIKFPNANYAPREGCKYCGGVGVKIKHPERPCICIYVPHDQCDFAAETLAKVAKELKTEMTVK